MLAPLKELESGATGGTVQMEAFQENASDMDKKSSEVLHPPSSNLIKSSPSQQYWDNESLVGGPSVEISEQDCKSFGSEPICEHPKFSSGISLEDAELETRALTEPLPTNQLVRKSSIVLSFMAHKVDRFKNSVSSVRHIKVIIFMLLRDGLPNIRYFIQGVLFLVIVLAIPSIHDLVSRRYKQSRGGCGMVYK